jgi:hypothetical protein
METEGPLAYIGPAGADPDAVVDAEIPESWGVRLRSKWASR